MADLTEDRPANARLLPWQSNGKPAYLVTDPSGESPLSRLADSVELQQVASAREVLRFSGMDQMGTATAPELQWICDRLREALHEVLRVAESRGERLL